MFKAIVHEVNEAFFLGQDPAKKRARSGDRLRPPPRSGIGTEARRWQQRAEEVAKRHASLMQAYKQMKARVESSPDWRGHSQKMLNELLRTMQACQFAEAVDGSADPAATLDNVLGGVRQLRDQILGFLCSLDFLQTIAPQPGEPFDPLRCTAAWSDDGSPVEDEDLTGAVVSELVEPGLAYNDQIVKPAMVQVAFPEQAANTSRPPGVK